MWNHRSVQRFVAFLGGINVGGHRVTMDRLRAAVTELGHTDVSTYIASGNVLFTGPARGDHETDFEHHLAAAFGWPVPTYVRTAREVVAIAEADPFGAVPDGRTHMVALCRTEPAAAAIGALEDDRNRFVVDGRDVHWLIDGGMSTSGITLPRLVKALGPMTTRNAKTVRAIAALVSPTAS